MDLAWLGGFPALIDIGANDGAYGAYLAKTFAIEEVHSFEPLSRYREALTARGFNAHVMALSDRNGEAEFVVTGYAPASSLMQPSAACIATFPEASPIGVEQVAVRRLDDVLEPIVGALIKVDAQGSEPAIIRGGKRVFEAARVVLVEMTFTPLYDGGGLFNDIHAPLADLGFQMRGFRSQNVGADGVPLFAHCIYVKPSSE